MKNLSTIRALKGANTSELLWNPSEGVWQPSEGGTLYLCITYNGISHEEFGISQKEVHFIYV